MLTELKDGETIVLQDKGVYLTNHRIIVEGMKFGRVFTEGKLEKMFEINLENISIVSITATTAFNF